MFLQAIIIDQEPLNVVDRSSPPQHFNVTNKTQSVHFDYEESNFESSSSFSSRTEHLPTYFTVKDKAGNLTTINYWIQALCIKLIPCILLTVLTVMLIVAMHDANVRRMKLKSQVINK